MIILGIDPALTVTGFGAVQAAKKKIILLEAGIISTCAKDPMEKRLERIYREILGLIQDTRPDYLVLEKIYSHYRHPATSYCLGQARGVICLAAAEKKVVLIEYAATRVKKAVIGNGLASKAQVQRMVMGVLGIKTAPKYLDVTDALALAIAHSYISEGISL